MSDPAFAAVAVRRSNQKYFEQVAQRETLPCGYAYCNPAHPRVSACNFLGEVLIDGDPPDPFAQVEAYFAARGATCAAWIPASDQDPDAVARVLSGHGFARQESMALALGLPAGAPDPELRFIGGRALRRAFTALQKERFAEHGPAAAARVELALERLNDPQYDAFVVTRADEPVAAYALYQVGELGRLVDLWVRPGARRTGVAGSAARHAALTAQRWALRGVYAQVSVANAAGMALAAKVGAPPGAPLVSFHRGPPYLPE